MNSSKKEGFGRVLVSLVVLMFFFSVFAFDVNADIDPFTASGGTGNTLTVGLTWTSADECPAGAGDDGDVDYYKIMRNGTTIYTEIATSYSDVVGDPGWYEYEIFAYNGSVICDVASTGTQEAQVVDNELPQPITYIDVMDYPNDQGDQILINWGHSDDYYESDDNYLQSYFITMHTMGDCSDAAIDVISLSRSECATPSYTWDELIPDTEYFFQVFGQDASGNNGTGKCDGTNTTDNLGPAPAENVDASDILDDQGEDGIDITWEKSPDQGEDPGEASTYKLYSRYGSFGDYSYFGNETIGEGEDNKTYWEYFSEFGGAFDSRVVAEYLGLFVPPFDSNTFYFYISAYDGTFETQSVHVSEAFNAEPTIEDMLIFPVSGTAQTNNDISCVSFICELNDDDTITAEVDFSVTHFYGQTGGEEVSKNASCVNLGKIESGVIPQYPYINIDCTNDLGEPGTIWECIGGLENTYTYMGDKVGCEMTPNDGKEDGDTVSYVDLYSFYPIENTAPSASEVEIAPNNPWGNDTLTCEFEFHDIDGDNESIIGTPYALQYGKYSTYKWYINNEGLNKYILLQGKNQSTLDEYYDQNDYVKCAVNPCDKDLSWLQNPLCQGESVEGIQGQEYWIMDGDVCAGFMSCGLMDETQCDYAASVDIPNNKQNWNCEWDDDNVEATAATLYGSKTLSGDYESGDLNYFNFSNSSILKILVNEEECQIKFGGDKVAPHYIEGIGIPSWVVLGCLKDASNYGSCGWFGACEDDPSAQECSDFDYDNPGNQTLCAAQVGCSWNALGPIFCEGTVNSCDTLTHGYCGDTNESNQMGCVWNNDDTGCENLYADRIELDVYDEIIDAVKLYTGSQSGAEITGADTSLVILDSDGDVLDSFGFEVGQQDVGTDPYGWCTGTINTQCSDLNSTQCDEPEITLSDGGFCYDPGTILKFINSTPKIIGGNSIPQIVSYSDDSTNISVTNVGEEVMFNATWVDVDPNEQGKLIVCPLEGGTDDYGCEDGSCTGNITFGDYGNTAWVYTNESSMMIETVEIKARGANISGTHYNETGESTPFLFSIIAFEADSNNMMDNPTSSLEGYYEDETIIIARSDWNPLTIGEWEKFTLQYNAQPLEGKYTGLKLCIADPLLDGINGGGPTGYSIKGATYEDINSGTNWFTKLIWDIGKFFRSIFSFTGRATTSYVDNCIELGHPDYDNSTVWIAAKNTSGGANLIFDKTWNEGEQTNYSKADIRINYQSSVGGSGSCPGPKTFCETELSPDRDVSCEYTVENDDETESVYHMRVCDDENSCSIWRSGYFYVNHLPYLDWTTIGTNHMGYDEGLTYTSDVNNDWNLQCIRGEAHDTDLIINFTNQIIIDADGWITPFQNQLEQDTNLVHGSVLMTCDDDTNLVYFDVNGDSDYDYKIDTLLYNQSGTYQTILQFSNESGGPYSTDFSTYCYFHDKNDNTLYDNGEDIIWDPDTTASDSTFYRNLNYTYEWFVKPYGSDEFDSCSNFLWCDNDGNDILTHGNTEPGDEWICSIKPIDSEGVGTPKNSSIIHVTSGTGGTPPGQGGPEITYVTDNSDENNIINFGNDVQINVGWEGPENYVRLYVCDGNSPYIRNSGCWGYEFNRSISSTSPIQSIFEVEDIPIFNTNDHGPINYSILLCNEEYDCSNASGDFYVNHIPSIEDIDLYYYDGSGYVSGSSTNSSSTLNCTVGAYDIENDISAFTYEWWVMRSGTWQLYWQEDSVYSSALLGYTSTQVGDTWKCSVTPKDAYSSGTEVESTTIQITTDSGSASNMSILDVVDDASLYYPINVGENTTFTIYWQNEVASSVVAYICDSPNVMATGCTGSATELGFSGWTSSNPITLEYEVTEEDYGNDNMTVNYYVRVCDNNFDCSDVYHEANTTMGTNHLPSATGMVLLNKTGGTFINSSHNITCNYSFSDMDNSLYNGLGYNASLYREQSDIDIIWYKYDYTSETWVEQSTTIENLSNTETSDGDRWKCGVQFNDGYVTGEITYSPERVLGGDSPIIDSVTTNTDEDDPLTYGEDLIFTVDWYDPQQGSGELIDLYICDNYSVNAGGCQDITFCERENTALDPAICTMDSSDLNGFSTFYTLTIFDTNGNMAQTNGTVYVNQEPIMNYTNLTPLYPINSDNLFCNASGYDNDGSTIDTYYNWYRDEGAGFSLYSYPNNETLLSQYTDNGQRWKCEVKVCDEYTCSDPMNSSYVTVTQYGANETPQVLNLNVDSTFIAPTNVGSPVIFTINWTDSDLEFGEYVQVFICNSTNIIENAGCVDKTFVNSGFLSSNPISVSYTVETEDNNETDAQVMLCDDEEICSVITTTQFYVNHVPEANNVSVLNSTNGNYFTADTYLNCSYTFNDTDATIYDSNYKTAEDEYFFWYKYVSGSWVDQEKNVQILPSTYTSLGEAWKCGVLTSDGYATGTQVNSEEIAIGNINPVIEYVSVNAGYDNPVKYGDSATFSIDWFDASPGESVEIFVCDSDNYNRYGCTDITLCSLTSVNSSPHECSYDTDGLDEGIVNQTYYVYIYDSTELNGSYNSEDNSNNMYVNHAPTIDYVNLTNDLGGIYPTNDDNLSCLGHNLSDIDLTSDLVEYGNDLDLIYTWYLDQGAGFFEYPYGGEVLTAWHTLEGDYWMCKVKGYDGYDYGTELSSSIRYIYGDEVSEIPEISYVNIDSSLTNPTSVGDDVTFTINWLDSDQPFGETVDVYICRSQQRYANGGCYSPYLESYSVGTNPIVIDYTTLITDLSNSTYYIQLVDSNGNESEWYNGENNTFGVNHRPNVTELRTAQRDEDTLECDFTYLDSNYGGLRADTELQDNYSSDYSWYKWYQYISGSWIEITVGVDPHSEYYEKEFVGGEQIKCSIKVGDELGLTDIQYQTSSGITVQAPPEIPTVWDLDSSVSRGIIELIGFVDESHLTNISVEAYSWQGYEEPKINQTSSLNYARFKGTSTLVDNFAEGSSYVVISGTNQNQFTAGSWIEFTSHNRTYFERYNITSKVTIIPGEQYRLNLNETLDENVTSGETVRSYNSSYPNGWFRFNQSLHSGTNSIKVRSKEDVGTGNVSSDFSEEQIVVYDNIKPNINTINILGYATSNQPLLEFVVSDNYLLNLSTLVLNVTDLDSGVSVYYLTNDSVYSYSNTGSNIACEHIISEVYECDVLINVNDGEYSLNFSVNDSANNFNYTDFSYYQVNATNPPIPDVNRNKAEYQYPNLTYVTDIIPDIDGLDQSMVQFAIGTNYYPSTGWNSVMDWTNITDYTTANEYIHDSDLDGKTWLNMSTGNLSLTPHTIYIANVRYRMHNWTRWSPVGFSQAMKYFPPYQEGDQPSAVNVTAPPFSFSPYIDVSWTESVEESYGVSHYLISAGTSAYPDTGWNNTLEWIYAGTGLSKIMDMNSLLDHTINYYFTVVAVSNIGVMGVKSSSYGTTYYDQTPPIVTVLSVANDTISYDGWKDTVNDGQTIVQISGDELMTCYYSPYDKDFQDYAPATDGYCDDGDEKQNMSCNIPAEGQGDFDYYIICEDSMEPQPNKQNRSQNTDLEITLDWPDDPEVTVTVTIFNNTNAPNAITGRSYALDDDTLSCTYVYYDQDGNYTVEVDQTDRQWLVNDVAVGATGEEITVSSYAEKEDNITCQVRVFDTTGRTSGWTDSNIIYVNNSVPTTPIIVLPLEDTYYKNIIRFNWTDSTDADDESIYYWIDVLNPNGINVANISWSNSNWNKNISDLVLWPAGNYNISVSACDEDICTESSLVEFGVDYVAPFVNITLPANNSIKGIYFDLYVDITDSLSGLNEYWYNLTNSSGDVLRSGILVLSGVDQYYAQVLTIGLDTGTYTITAYAVDYVGNENSSSRTIRLDLDSPQMVVDPDSWRFREQWLKDDLNITIEINQTSTIYPDDTENLTEVDYTIRYSDGTLKESNSMTSENTSFIWNQSFDTTGWVEGRYDVVVNVEDYWNNTNTLTTWFMVDRTAPGYENMDYEPSSVFDSDDINISVDLLNNVFIWNANENNINKDLTYFQYNKSTNGKLTNLTISDGNLSYAGNNFYAIIPESYTEAEDVIQWRAIVYDLAGNMRATEWQTIAIASTAPTFDSNIEDISWPEDTVNNSLNLSDHFSDEDEDTLTYTVDILPKGTLLYDDFNNLSDTEEENNGSYENVVVENGLNNNALLIQSEVNNLLINGDFEDSDYDEEYIEIPNSWMRHSYPTYSHAGPPGAENFTTVDEHNYYSQAVAVTADETYTLSMYVINDSDPGYGRMHINWFNSLYPTDTSVNKTSSYLSSTLDCSEPYNCTGIYYLNVTYGLNSSDARRTLILDSPSNAAYAEIVLDTDSADVSARINDVQFEQKDYPSVFYDGHRLPGSLYYPVETNRGRDRLNLEEGTITMFVKPTWGADYTNNEQEIFFNIKSSNVDIFILSAENETLTFSLNDESYNVEQNISDWEEGTWYFVAMNWDSSGLSLTINNVMESETAPVSFGINVSIEDTAFYIGSDSDGANQANAYIDEFAIFDYVKSSSELNDIYTNENSSYIEEPISASITAGVVSLTPGADYFGEQRAIFYGSDAYTKIYSNMINLNVTPVDDAPRFNTSNSIDNQSWWVNQNEEIDLDGVLYDVDGSGALTYVINISDGSGNLSLSYSGTTITLIPDTDWTGTEEIFITAYDATASNVSNVFNATVYFNWLNNTWVNGTYYDDSTTNYDNSLTGIYQTEAYDSNITDIEGHLIINSQINNSNISNSNVTNSVVINSTLIDINLIDAFIVNAYIDPSNITNSTISGNARIIDSFVLNSHIDNSSIYNSYIYNWIVEDANITDNEICWGRIYDGQYNLLNETIWAGGPCQPLINLLNYDPRITEFTVSVSGSNNEVGNVNFDLYDPDFDSTSGDNVTYSVNFGDGYTEQGVLTSNNGPGTVSNIYTSSGTYTITLTLEDEAGATDVDTRSIIISISGGSSPNPPSPGGGSGGGGGSNSNDDEEEDDDEEDYNYVGQATSGITASCVDGIKNQGEQGVDCGGPCPPCLVKATCYDNIRNQGEEETDCGGPCKPCKEKEEESALSLFPYFIALLIAAIIIFFVAMYMPKKKRTKQTVGLSKGPITSSGVGIEQHPLPHHIAIQSAISVEQNGDVFEALRQYINARLRQGTDKGHIKETLMMKGWPEEVVDVALDGSTELEGRLREVEDYIRNSFASGYKLKQIKIALMQRGWSKGIVDLLLFEVHRPTRNLKNLREYVDYKIMQGKNLSEIKQILRSVGWKEGVIDSLLK